METASGNERLSNGKHRELARRSGDGVDVTLMWDAGADSVFVVVDDQRRGERFRITVDGGDALDAFHHPYAYDRRHVVEQDAVSLA